MKKFLIVTIAYLSIGMAYATDTITDDTAFYHCSGNDVTLSFFQIFKRGWNLLDVVVNGKTIYKSSIEGLPKKELGENLVVTNDPSNLHVQAFHVKKDMRMSFLLEKPSVEPHKQANNGVVPHQVFQTELLVHRRSSVSKFKISCEVFGLNYEFFDLLPSLGSIHTGNVHF